MKRMGWMSGGLLVALGFVLAASSAEAHAKLVQSSPAADSVVEKSPPEVRLKFSEPIAVKLSRVGLTTAKGSEVAAGPVSADPGDETELVVPLKEALPPGTYHVHWHIVSEDMHKVEGDFDFEVRR